MALVHFNASLYPTVESREAVQEKVAREADNIIVAFDDMVAGALAPHFLMITRAEVGDVPDTGEAYQHGEQRARC